MDVGMGLSTRLGVGGCVCLSLCVCVCVFVCMYVRTYMYVCVNLKLLIALFLWSYCSYAKCWNYSIVEMDDPDRTQTVTLYETTTKYTSAFEGGKVVQKWVINNTPYTIDSGVGE